MDLEDFIKKFVKEKANDEVDNDLNLVEAGILDSFAFVELLTSLEDTYSIEIDLSEIDLDNFNSINLITKKCLSINAV